MIWEQLQSLPTEEIIATIAAVLSVILIARQNALGWPLGILWAAISAWLAYFRWQLISDAILYISYIPIQLYCWRSWKTSDQEKGKIQPSWLTQTQQFQLVVAALLATLVWGLGVQYLSQQVAWIPKPSLLWTDAASTVLNYFAQFLQVRKRMDNWLGWLIVNLLGMYNYWMKGSEIYTAQYGFFLLLGLYGWWSWHQTMKKEAAC